MRKGWVPVGFVESKALQVEPETGSRANRAHMEKDG